jgi:hypothetical protein
MSENEEKSYPKPLILRTYRNGTFVAVKIMVTMRSSRMLDQMSKSNCSETVLATERERQ